MVEINVPTFWFMVLIGIAVFALGYSNGRLHEIDQPDYDTPEEDDEKREVPQAAQSKTEAR